MIDVLQGHITRAKRKDEVEAGKRNVDSSAVFTGRGGEEDTPLWGGWVRCGVFHLVGSSGDQWYGDRSGSDYLLPRLTRSWGFPLKPANYRQQTTRLQSSDFVLREEER